MTDLDAQRMIRHLASDLGVALRVVDNALAILRQIHMDTDEDRALHDQAIAAIEAPRDILAKRWLKVGDAYLDGADEVSRCTAGQAVYPEGCDWHSPHHYCESCLGWYGVPHNFIHDEAHVRDNAASGCACRPCTERRKAKP